MRRRRRLVEHQPPVHRLGGSAIGTKDDDAMTCVSVFVGGGGDTQARPKNFFLETDVVILHSPVICARLQKIYALTVCFEARPFFFGKDLRRLLGRGGEAVAVW